MRKMEKKRKMEKRKGEKEERERKKGRRAGEVAFCQSRVRLRVTRDTKSFV